MGMEKQLGVLIQRNYYLQEESELRIPIGNMPWLSIGNIHKDHDDQPET
jgi:hypothetical protein